MRKALPLTLLLTVACSGQVLSPGRDRLEAEIEELKARVLELQRKAAVSEIEMARLRRQVASLSLRAEGSPSPSRPTEPASEVGIFEPSPPSPAPPPTKISESDLAEHEPEPPEPEPTAAPEPSPAAPRSAASAGSGPAEPGPAEPRPVSVAEQRLYDDGYTLYHRQQYVDAEAAFQTFLDAHPSSDLADNAQYWIGECRYAREDYRGALAAFRETVNRHPEGNKVPDALLKAGQTLEVLGDLSSARKSYREVQRRFPDSAAALVAAERLEDLSS